MNNTLDLTDQALSDILNASTTDAVTRILKTLPIVDPEDYHLDYGGKIYGEWRDGYLHWLPVGMERGNGGRIKLAGKPTNPIAERLVNGQESAIELERLRELARDPSATMPTNPREAVERYFGLPRLDTIPRVTEKEQHRALIGKINEARKKLNVRLYHDKRAKEFAVAIRDEGMGQEPGDVHKTLLSLGQTDKADKPYMIGVFGQGGSSAFAASEVSTILSRRAPDLVQSTGDSGIGWTIVRQIIPKGRRDFYYAYLAVSSDGTVPQFSAEAADLVGFTHGCRFAHIDFDFGGTSSAVARTLYQSLNHVLFNPMLPYDLFTLEKERPELMQGTAQRLARQAAAQGDRALDKSFISRPVGERVPL